MGLRHPGNNLLSQTSRRSRPGVSVQIKICPKLFGLGQIEDDLVFSI